MRFIVQTPCLRMGRARASRAASFRCAHSGGARTERSEAEVVANQLRESEVRGSGLDGASNDLDGAGNDLPCIF